MELRDLEYFAVIAEHGHLGRAAAALKISQPALSKSLRRLETALAVKLTKRTPKGVELTSEGAALHLRVRDLRLSLADVAREIKDVSEGRVGQLHIGAGPAVSEDLLSAACAKLLQDAPRMTLKASVSDNDVMIPSLTNGELDLVVNYRWIGHSDAIVYEPLYDDDFVVCAAGDHRLAGRRRVKLSDLAQERWGLSEASLLSSARLREIFRDAGLPPPRVAFECRAIPMRLRTVAHSNLLDFTSETVVRQLETSAIAIIPVPELAWRRSVGVTRRRGGYLSPAARRFADILRSLVKQTSSTRR
jgi:DNA-binding transcriptional LysR family regulator